MNDAIPSSSIIRWIEFWTVVVRPDVADCLGSGMYGMLRLGVYQWYWRCWLGDEWYGDRVARLKDDWWRVLELLDGDDGRSLVHWLCIWDILVAPSLFPRVSERLDSEPESYQDPEF